MFKVHWNGCDPQYRGKWLHLTKHDPRVPHWQRWVHTLCGRKVPPHCWIEGEKPPSIHWEHDNTQRPICSDCSRRQLEPNQMIQLSTKAQDQIRLMHRCLAGEATHEKVEISAARNGCKTATAQVHGIDHPVMLIAQNVKTRSVYAKAASEGAQISWLMTPSHMWGVIGNATYLGPVVWTAGNEVIIGTKEQLADYLKGTQ